MRTCTIFSLIVGLCWGLSLSPAHAQCNGDIALCSKRFDEVCYATTHNAFNYQGAFLFPNQSHGVSQQLQGGVRGLMLDVYWYNNAPTCYHSSNWLGNQPLSTILADIKAFLDANPNEVVSIIFESYVTAAQMNDAFTQANLLTYLHTQPQGTDWPTLEAMILANQRLVVFTDATDGQAYPWYHHVWDYAVETHYSAASRADFSCDYNRGDSSQSLFILNHFVTEATLGYGLIDSAAAVNANPYLTSRAMGCWAATGKMPNFLTVDFYEQGDVMAAKDALNAGFVGAAGGLSALSGITVAPNPVQDQICLQWTGAQPITAVFSLYDAQGRLRLRQTIHSTQAATKIAMPEELGNGIYGYRLESPKGIAQGKLSLVR